MFWSVGTMVMTVLHHFYGAYIYDEPFRLHVAIIAIPVIAVLITTYIGQVRVGNRTWNKGFRVVFTGATLIFSVAAIGIYEGGYNHLVKDVLFFSGVSTRVLDAMYPSVYELPNDFFFELTGVAQFFTGVACAFVFFRTRRVRSIQL